jgi:transcriptional regulator with XRE-family HTH domain
MNQKEIGARIRNAREWHGWSQQELSDKCRIGLGSGIIELIETGEIATSLDTLEKVADALKITTDFLLGRFGYNIASEKSIPEIVAAIDALHQRVLHLEQNELAKTKKSRDIRTF